VRPTLEFIITSKDITATGAPATLLIFNNEKGFSRENIESLCSVGRSTKKGNRSSGYIGEKGILSHLFSAFAFRKTCVNVVPFIER
jgi:sacsin